MTYEEMQKKYLGLIEELDPNSEQLTQDPDIAAKQIEVTNQVMFELARMKKIPKYVVMEVNEGDLVTYETIEKECGYEVYQIHSASGVHYNSKAGGTVLKILESGTLELDIFVYPERITERTKPKAYEFELSPDVLEIMPYGIAADLLKSDESMGYGAIYEKEYEKKLARLDPRYQMANIYVEGGVDI